MNVLKLKIIMLIKGVSVDKLSRSVKINRSSLYRKLSNVDTIKIGEAKRIKEALALTDREIIDIFFD